MSVAAIGKSTKPKSHWLRVVLVSMVIGIIVNVLSGCSHFATHSYGHYEPIEHTGNYELAFLGFEQSVKPYVSVHKAHKKIIYSYANSAPPTIFSVFLLEHSEVKEGESVLDMGSGSGVLSIHAAEKASHILATDISDEALKGVELNARRYGVDNKIEVRKSNIFDAIGPDETFDVMFVTVPYPYDERTQGLWELYERFFAGAPSRLNPKGRIYLMSGQLENVPRVREMVLNNNLKIMRMDMSNDVKYLREKIVYRIEHFPEELIGKTMKDPVRQD